MSGAENDADSFMAFLWGAVASYVSENNELTASRERISGSWLLRKANTDGKHLMQNEAHSEQKAWKVEFN